MKGESPLRWPEHWPRTNYPKDSRFKETTRLRAWKDLSTELDRFGATHVIVSSNCALNHDGRPRYNAKEPQDGAVAVYFHWKGQPFVVACDTYLWVWENTRAVTKTLDAMRAIKRHGASQLLERAVSGFSALPPARDAKPQRPWWEVLGLDVGEDSLINPDVLKAVIADPDHPMRRGVLKMAEALFRVKASEKHPDLGGDAEAFAEVNGAIESAREQLGERDE